jgi:hypothetical protein
LSIEYLNHPSPFYFTLVIIFEANVCNDLMVSNPISQSYINNKIKSKENAKITNKLIRNEDMTKEEAIKAKKQLKNNSLPPALSTRSKDRVLRSNK